MEPPSPQPNQNQEESGPKPLVLAPTTPGDAPASPPPQPSESDGIEYNLSPREEAFLEYYTQRTSKETFGNATKSAIKAYNLDPVRQYNYARSLGAKIVAKTNNLARDYMEERGFNLFNMVEIGIQKMNKTDSPVWWDRLMEMAEYKKKDGPLVEVNNNTQVNNFNVNAPEIQEFNKKFIKILEDL